MLSNIFAPQTKRVKGIYLSILLVLVFCHPGVSQQSMDSLSPIVVDSAISTDSLLTIPPQNIPLLKDSVSKRPAELSNVWQFQGTSNISQQVFMNNPYFGFSTAVFKDAEKLHQHEDKDLLFYVLIALLILFSILKGLFSKYFSDLFRLFFRTTLKQRQIREQLVQTPLPSLLMNLFFVITAGLYCCFLLLHFEKIGSESFWVYWVYSMIALCTIYIVKFVGLKLLGWIFNYREAAESYTFIVFVVNKIIGFFLLPFLFFLAFVPEPGYSTALLISWIGLGCIFLYRFILTYSAIRNQVKFNIFHFFLYLCAFEIAPLLLIYNLLLSFFR